jgi:hypothetical protein
MLKPQRKVLQCSGIRCHILQQICTRGYREIEIWDSHNGAVIWDANLCQWANSSSHFRDHTAYTFTGKQLKKTVWPWRWRQYNPSKHQRIFTQWHSITPRRPHFDTHYYEDLMGHTSHWPLATKVLVQSQASKCGIGGERKWKWDRFSSEYFDFLLSVSFQQCSRLIN